MMMGPTSTLSHSNKTTQGVLERPCAPLLLMNGIQDSVFPIEDDYLLLQHTELMQQGEIVP